MKSGLFGSVRFVPDSGDGYTASADKNGLALTLSRSDLFAWMENPGSRYTDFVLDADLSIDGESGYSSVGFMFRQRADSEYYYFLVSSKGYYRFDIVLNGTPEEIIGWTRLSTGPERDYGLRILANGPSFRFFVNGAWAGEARDDRIDAGTISFCGQNYGEAETALMRCRALTLESRPFEIENHASGMSKVPEPGARRRLAESYGASGRYNDQVAQLQRVVLETGGTADDFFQLARGFIHMNLYDSAIRALEKCLAAEPGHPMARQVMADMLYLTDRIDTLKPMLPSLIEDFPDNAFLLNLAGNTGAAGGNWKEACEYYRRAAGLEPEEPLYLEHAAGALERTESTGEARDLYEQAAWAYFKGEHYGDATRIIRHLETSPELSPDMKALRGKLLFQENDLAGALDIFENLIDAGYRDGSVFFLTGLMYAFRGRRQEAGEYFRKAVEMEEDYYLYRFRLAENSFLLGEDCLEDIERALELQPDDGWVLNLAGQVFMEREDHVKAAECLEKAAEILPGETDVRINLSEAWFMAGNPEKAFSVLGNDEEDAAVLNHRGNLFARSGRIEEAIDSYSRASVKAPERVEYIENCAAAYIEGDMPLKAEELLSRVLEEHPGARAFNLMGNCLGMTGNYKRSEAAYLEAVRLEPDWDEPRLNLADLYVTLGELDNAEILLKSEGLGSNDRARRLSAKLERLKTESISCSICGRAWTVPRELGDQGNLKIVGEPPKDLPAGRCPSCGRVYCIDCVSDHLDNSRFVCPDCGDYLKLNDDRLKYILKQYFEETDISGKGDL